MTLPYAVTGAAGRTGSAAARALLERGLPVRVILREAAKAAMWHQRGAEIVIADLTDVEAMTDALRDTSAAYIVSPQAYARDDVFEHAEAIADAIAAAARRAAVPRLVALSSIGAGRDHGTGWIGMNAVLERRLASLPIPVAFLRAAYFLENWQPMIDEALRTGKLASFLSPVGRRMPMVATEDVGHIAAALIAEEWTAQRIIEVDGPADYAPDDVAEALSRRLGREIVSLIVPDDDWASALTAAGLSVRAFEGFVAMTRGLNSGHIAFHEDGRFERRSGAISLESAVARMVHALSPALSCDS